MEINQKDPENTRAHRNRKGSSSEEEDIVIKNIDTGQTHLSSQLNKQLSPVSLNKHNWNSYFHSLKQLTDKLLQLLMKKQYPTIQQLLIEYPINLNQLHYFGGWTLLHFAVSINDPISADLLLKFGQDVDSQTEEMKRTPLHEATLSNKIELVELLVSWGANPNICDQDRNTPMHFAVDYGYLEVVKILIASSEPIDLNIRNNQNMTPFNTCRTPEIFQLLFTYSQKQKKSFSRNSKDTTASSIHHHKDNYQSRLIVRNSDVIPHSSRADMVEKFLSLRENPGEAKSPQNQYGSIISEESYQSSVGDRNEHLLSSTVKKKQKLKKIGSCLRSASIKNSFRIASQNIGLMRQSIIKTHLENEQVIEDYDKLRKLGSGAFAQVYLVRKKRSSTLLALKAIDKARVADDGLRRYIDAERFVLTQIQHPFILHAQYCLQDFTHLYILTEFCVGGDLQKIVRKHPLPEQITKTYVCEAALAIEQLHKHGMLYRDLKAANTLLDAEGHLRLADFGLSKHATTSDSFLGSMSYLAPEMLVKQDSKAHGIALDWYLLGIFAYELLHGLPPFYCEQRQQMQSRILHDAPTFSETISKQSISAISKLLTKNQYQRMANLDALKQQKWLKDINWKDILEKKGNVLKMEMPTMKELRKKQYFEDPYEDYAIDDKIQWYDNWNYPSQHESQ